MRLAFLLVASLTLSACAVSTPQSTPPTRPPLDSKLSALCPPIAKPDAGDYDLWQVWSMELLEQYGICAARHAKTVQAWPK